MDSLLDWAIYRCWNGGINISGISSSIFPGISRNDKSSEVLIVKFAPGNCHLVSLIAQIHQRTTALRGVTRFDRFFNTTATREKETKSKTEMFAESGWSRRLFEPPPYSTGGFWNSSWCPVERPCFFQSPNPSVQKDKRNAAKPTKRRSKGGGEAKFFWSTCSTDARRRARKDETQGLYDHPKGGGVREQQMPFPKPWKMIRYFRSTFRNSY